MCPSMLTRMVLGDSRDPATEPRADTRTIVLSVTGWARNRLALPKHSHPRFLSEIFRLVLIADQRARQRPQRVSLGSQFVRIQGS